MEFVNKLKHVGDEEQREQQHSESQEPAKHGGESGRDFLGKLIAGAGLHGSKHDSDGDDDKVSLFDKLRHKEEREKKAAELEKREAEIHLELERVAREKKDNEGFFERLKERIGGDDGKETEEKKHHEPREDDEPSFFDKITGKDEREKKAAELDRKEEELRAELEKVEHEKRENQGILERLKDHLEKGEEEKKAEEEKPSFLDKITGKAAEEERRRKEEENKGALEKIKDQINEALGGGRTAEEKEDLLDKTIDAFQEHVLHQPDQSNESALEQMKDEKIAAVIRSQLHLRDNKDEE